MGTEENKPSSGRSRTRSQTDHAADAFAQAMAGGAKPKARKPQLVDVYRILAHSEPWQGVIAYDEFSGRIVKRKPPPFAPTEEPGEWADVDDTRTLMWISEVHGFQPHEKDLIRAIDACARENSFHEVREYLERLKWDGIERLPMWPVDILGVEDSQYARIVGLRWMIAGVARVMRPGVKVDNVLILVGPQGRMKSTVFAILAAPWFTDAPVRFGDKETAMMIRGKWVVELAELDAFSRADDSAAKAFFTTAVDRYRVPWGRRPADVPRQCVFAGTVNPITFLKDPTGGRRYWPLIVGEQLQLEKLREVRDQLWAEAFARYARGEPWWATSEEKALFEEVQERHYVGDAWEPRVSEYVQKTLLIEKLHEFTTYEVMNEGLKLDTRAMDRNAQTRVGALLQRMGLVRERASRAGPDGKRPYVYMTKEAAGSAKAGGDDDVEI